jgi:cytoskeletal protein CcmA (bactofilin family)
VSPAQKRGFFFSAPSFATRQAIAASNFAKANQPEGPDMKSAAFAIAATIVLIAWGVGEVSLASDGRDLSSVNGGITASAGETYGTLSTVNGEVHVGRGVTADKAKTVNGEIDVENDVKLGEVSTVNGELEIGDDVVIARTASTVNGSIELGKRTRVGGDVSTVSGEIELDGAEVGGKVTTRNGDIELLDGARIRGGIHIKTKNDNGWRIGKDEPVKVHICSTCVVDGELRFDRPVELRVDAGAKIGNVIGDSVTRR